MRKLVFLPVLLVFLLASCEEKQADNDDGGDSTQVENKSKLAEEITSIAFKDSLHDFGLIEEGIKVSHVFKFTNTGEYPLRISDARASCGCTVPEYTKDPIAPGEEGEIKVIYDSSNRGGQKINKTVTVIANTEPSATNIQIKAEIKQKIDGPYNTNK